MRLILLFLSLLIVPASAQEAAQWQVEQGSPRRAATIEYEESATLSYGFSCWRNHWVFFFNYQAPEGGICPNHEACETDVADVTLTFKTANREDFTDRFTLFENYYFQAEDLGLLDIEAMVKAGGFQLQLDDKLKNVWSRERIEFTLKGFEEAVRTSPKVFSCAVHAPLPAPLMRPTKAVLDGKIVTTEKPAKVQKKKSRKAELKEKRSRAKMLKKIKKTKTKIQPKKKHR
ncbi:MAG: hypothetical protein V4691_00765 [Pseudomonadota bacterium]